MTDERREYLRKYREKNKEKIQEYRRKYYEKNKEEIKSRTLEYYEKNKDKIKEIQKQYYQNHREQILSKMKEKSIEKQICDNDCFNCKYKDCIKTFDNYRAYSDYSEKEKEKIRKRQKIYTKQNRAKAKENGLCSYCFKKPRYNGLLACYECRIKRIKYARKTYEHRTKKEEWMKNGMCLQCGEMVYKNYKLCLKHYNILIEAGKKGAEVQKENHNNFMKIVFGKNRLE